MSNSVLIVGAGPAGVSAAVTLAKQGLTPTLIDEASRIGGVIYRGPFRDSIKLDHLDDKLQASMIKLRQDFACYQDKIELRLNTKALGPDGDRALFIQSEGKMSSLAFDQLILATGCQERSIPFPGWELPGVMLLGGMQLQLKCGLVRPGTQAVVVGSGPLLPLVGCQLHKAEVEVQGIFEAASFSEFASITPALLNKPSLALQGMGMLSYLKQQKIPFQYGWGIVEARGDQQLEEVVVAPYNHKWQADLSRKKTIKADCMAVGYGFMSRNQLAQLMQLEHSYCDVSGIKPKTNQWQQTSNPDIYVAGDSVGIHGALAAHEEGHLAALHVLSQHQLITAEALASQAEVSRKRLHKLYAFRKGFEKVMGQRGGLLELADADTTVCRCENVKRTDIDQALSQGVKDIVTLKMRTRISMGDCQGKTCSSYCYDRIKRDLGQVDTGKLRPRFPLDLIPFNALEEN